MFAERTILSFGGPRWGYAVKYKVRKSVTEEFEIEEVTPIDKEKHPILKWVAIVTIVLLSTGAVGVLSYGWATQNTAFTLGALSVIGAPLAMAAGYLFRK